MTPVQPQCRAHVDYKTPYYDVDPKDRVQGHPNWVSEGPCANVIEFIRRNMDAFDASAPKVEMSAFVTRPSSKEYPNGSIRVIGGVNSVRQVLDTLKCANEAHSNEDVDKCRDLLNKPYSRY